MSDLIDRQAAIKKVQAYHFRYPEYMDGFVNKVLSAIKADLVEDIEELPTAEPKTGRWKPYPIADGCIQCSVCGILRVGEPSNYCPNCGARMGGDA